MELIALAIASFLLGGVAGGTIVWSYYHFINQRQRRNADLISSRQADLTALYGQLADKMEEDPARLGIDVGKEYAVHKMQMTLDEVKGEIE